jgi:hypothetical protein
MVRRIPGMELIIILVFGGLFTLIPVAGHPAKGKTSVWSAAPSTGPSSTTKATVKIDDLSDDLKQYLYDSDVPAAASRGDARFDSNDPRYSMRVESLIVTLPDPLQSKLADEFDLLLESVQEAAGTAGYSLGHFFLPWLPEGEVPANQLESSVLPRIELARREPGVMLFSKDNGASLLVVFVVGETPRFGIHKRALLSALRQAAALPKTLISLITPRGGSVSDDSAREFRILGPPFLGRETRSNLRYVNGQETRSILVARFASSQAVRPVLKRMDSLLETCLRQR